MTSEGTQRARQHVPASDLTANNFLFAVDRRWNCDFDVLAFVVWVLTKIENLPITLVG